MKKAGSLLMALVMLLSAMTGAIPHAAATETADTEVKPFYGLGWSPIDETLFPNCDDVVTIGVRPTADLEVEFYKDDAALGTDVDKLLSWLKAQMDSRPAGTRYLHVYNTLSIAAMNPTDVIDLSDGFDKLKVKFTDFLRQYSAMGGQLDGLVLDCEYIETYAWYVYFRQYAKGNTEVYNAIVASDLYKNTIRPELVARGFQFWPDPSGVKSEIWGIYPYSGDAYVESRRIWDKVMRNSLNTYMTDALYTPFIQYYPNGWVSDYQSADAYGWHKAISGSGAVSYSGGNSVKVGNTSNNNAYGYMPNGEFYITPQGEVVYRNPISYNGAVYEKTSFNMFQWEINGFKKMYLATDTEKITAWFAGYDYADDRMDSYCGTPYYSEVALHIGLLDPDPFLLYVYRGDYDTNGEYNATIQVLSELMSELTRVVGAADRKPIAVEETWNYGFVLSGMYAGGRNVWRITPDTSLVSVEDFKTVGKYPTFTVNGVTVIFPHGRIIETGDISQVGSCGYWIQTPQDVQPVILCDADRYSKYPSFLESFEGYAASTAITSETAQPETAWEVSGTSPVVKEMDGNKLLALTGSAVMHNVKLPANITSGDFYAKQQAWEVTVTLPAGLNTDAQVQLLSAANDGGLKIEGGKLYYAQNGAYTELAGVDLSAGGTYTVKRELDFRTDGAFTSDYAIYDANGNLLGSVTDVGLSGLALPVASIGIACANVTGEVFVDDYKLYPTGVTSDFEVYDASAGVLVADAGQARDQDSAYRLSWMNAGDAPKAATVVAAYYDSEDNLLTMQNVAEILMMPGADGVETDIVEVTEGQKVLLSVIYDEDPVVELPVIDNDPNCEHMESEPYTENVIAADCINAGSYQEVTYCTDCWAEMSRETRSLEPTGIHSYGIVIDGRYLKTPADQNSAAVYYKSCSVCGLVGTETFLYGHPLSDSEPGSGDDTGTVTGITTAITMPARTTNYTLQAAYGSTTYYVTPDAEAGYITSTGASQTNWNVKVDNTGLTPVIYLKSATIKGRGSSPVISATHDLRIVVLEESQISGAIGIRTSSGGNLTVASENNAKLYVAATAGSTNDAALATQGGGAIVLENLVADLSSGNSAGVIYIAATADTTDITIKDSTINIDQTNASGYGIWTKGGTVTIRNSAVDIDSSGHGIRTEAGGVYIAKGSDVDIHLTTIGDSYNAINAGDCDIYIADSAVTAVREATWNNTALVQTAGALGIVNSEVTFVVKNTNLSASYKYGLFKAVPDVAFCTAQASAESAPTNEQLEAYAAGNANTYKYFTTTLTATDPEDPCASNGCRADEIVIENEVAAGCVSVGSYEEVGYCAVCGTEVSREIRVIPAGIHDYAQIVDVQYLKSVADFDSAAVYYKSCQLCGAKGSETFTHGDPLAGGNVAETAIAMPAQTTNYTVRVAQGGVVYYLTPDAQAGYIASAGASQTNWNVKVDNTGSVPVVYLKGAYIKNIGTQTAIAATHDLKVVVVEESWISGTLGIRTSEGGTLMVTSENGAKLHIDITSSSTNGAALATQGGGAILLKNLVADLSSGNSAGGTIYIAATAETTDISIVDSVIRIDQNHTAGYGIWTKGGDIFVSGSTVDVDSAGHGITANAGTVNIANNSNVNVELGTASTGNAICSTGTGIEIRDSAVTCVRLNTDYIAGPMIKATAGVFNIVSSNVAFAVHNTTGAGNVFHSTYFAPTVTDCTVQASATVGGTPGDYQASRFATYKTFVTTAVENT